MYEKVKALIKKIIPKSVLQKNEDLLRSIVALKYRGNEYECNICNYSLSSFIHLSNGSALCPKCGSISRTRRLWDILSNEMDLRNKSILHFSPPKGLNTKLKSSGSSKYISTDYEGEFKADKKLNILDIDEPDNSFDIIICYHILEHIQDDIRAMEQLYRILSTEGKCIIQTPFKDGDIYEDSSIKPPEERLVHFGQEDHVRIYSIDGLKSRLEQVGFSCEVISKVAPDENIHGFQDNETILMASKN